MWWDFGVWFFLHGPLLKIYLTIIQHWPSPNNWWQVKCEYYILTKSLNSLNCSISSCQNNLSIDSFVWKVACFAFHQIAFTYHIKILTFTMVDVLCKVFVSRGTFCTQLKTTRCTGICSISSTTNRFDFEVPVWFEVPAFVCSKLNLKKVLIILSVVSIVKCTPVVTSN